MIRFKINSRNYNSITDNNNTTDNTHNNNDHTKQIAMYPLNKIIKYK
jgi:hypothetical protein